MTMISVTLKITEGCFNFFEINILNCHKLFQFLFYLFLKILECVVGYSPEVGASKVTGKASNLIFEV